MRGSKTWGDFAGSDFGDGQSNHSDIAGPLYGRKSFRASTKKLLARPPQTSVSWGSKNPGFILAQTSTNTV